MLNILLIFIVISLVLSLSLVIVDKYFGKEGLLMIQIIIILLSNIIVVKRFPIFGDKSLTMSVMVYPFIFVGMNLIANKYGEKVAKKYSTLTVISNFLFVIVMTIGTYAKSATGSNPVDQIFSIMDHGHLKPGLVGLNIVGFITLYIALFASRSVFNFLHKKFHFTVSTLVSAFVGDVVDSVIFVIFGLWIVAGFLPANSVVPEILTMIIAKTIVSSTNTLLLSRKANNEENQENDENQEKEQKENNENMVSKNH